MEDNTDPREDQAKRDEKMVARLAREGLARKTEAGEAAVEEAAAVAEASVEAAASEASMVVVGRRWERREEGWKETVRSSERGLPPHPPASISQLPGESASRGALNCEPG